MAENFRLMRFYLSVLLLFTIGRWALSLGGAEYDKAHQVFSVVTLAFIASAHHAAFGRAFQGMGLKRAVGLGMMIGFATQLVIFTSTALSYALGLETFWNAPRALNSPGALTFGAAMATRTLGIVAGTIANGVAAAIGWLLGAAFPRTAGLRAGAQG
jgi:hypothetical protein